MSVCNTGANRQLRAHLTVIVCMLAAGYTLLHKAARRYRMSGCSLWVSGRHQLESWINNDISQQKKKKLKHDASPDFCCNKTSTCALSRSESRTQTRLSNGQVGLKLRRSQHWPLVGQQCETVTVPGSPSPCSREHAGPDGGCIMSSATDLFHHFPQFLSYMADCVPYKSYRSMSDRCNGSHISGFEVQSL